MDKLKSYLAERKVSVPEFARAIRVHDRTAYKYVRGERIPDREVMPRIFEWTGGEITANDFYGLHPTEAA